MKSTRRATAAPSLGLSGRYELREELARGGMGIVYRAFDKLAAREVAYKRLSVPDGASRARFAALFEREYNALAQLTHPAIVSVFEYGFDAQGPYYTMELLEGQGLTELAPMPYVEVCRVMRDVASALALLHARKLIHRDLSPANVRVQPDGRTKLIDFGALTAFGRANEVVGTPAFMAPEAHRDAELDQRADLYALGALLYWALTRQTAVRARGLDDLPMAWLDPITRPSAHVPEIPAALEELVLSLLARDPLARPASAAEVIERLTSIAELSPEPQAAKVAASYMAHPPLVGRSEVLAKCEVALRGASRAQGTCLLVEAEQGRGRSALLESLGVRAQLQGATVLRAAAGSTGTGYGVARSLVLAAVAIYPELLGGSAGRDPDLKQVLSPSRAVRGEAVWSPVQASERQARVLSLMQDILLKACVYSPTLIVVDDLHEADSESQALFAALAEEAKEHALLLVVSARLDAQAGGSDAYVKIKANAKPLQLSALSVDQTSELIDSMFGGAANGQRLARWLHERSGGNPARCMDLTRLLLQRGLIQYAAGGFTLPHDVSDDVTWQDDEVVLLARLADLSATARAAATLLSVQDLPMRVDHLAQALAVPAREAILALEELAARAAVSLADERACLVSSSLRSALRGGLEPARKQELHLAAARAILADSKLDGALRMQAGMHLLEAARKRMSGARAQLLDFAVPLLESVLEVLRKQGRSDEQCLSVLVPLVRGGFFGDLQAQQRHIDRTLLALAKVCGVSAMAKLRPWAGDKPALIGGVVSGLVHHARTPANMRYGKYPETVAALLSILSASVAATVSAFETKQAFDIINMFKPLRSFGADSAPYWSIEFCLATAELGVNRYTASRTRYQRLLERFQRPVKGMNEAVHLQFKQGILHGLAQALVADTDPECLRLADELEQAHMFFAPHAQTVRMGYHGLRGEADRVTEYRRRGELLALRGGISWSAVTIMTVRSAYMALQTSDMAALSRAPTELVQLATTAPKMALYRDAMLAALELLRGKPERARQAYEQLFSLPEAEFMMAHWTDRTMYARTLSALGQHAEARAVCETLLAKLGPDEVMYVRKGAIQQLALALAAGGEIEAATQQLDGLIARLAPYDNPLWSGTAQRERAKVALFAQDQAGFERHARAMTEHYQSTRNPALIQQCDLLYAAAKAQARGPRQVAVLDEAALAFETHQSRVITSADMDTFETEMMPGGGAANDQAKIASDG